MNTYIKVSHEGCTNQTGLKIGTLFHEFVARGMNEQLVTDHC